MNSQINVTVTKEGVKTLKTEFQLDFIFVFSHRQMFAVGILFMTVVISVFFQNAFFSSEPLRDCVVQSFVP